MYTKKVSTKRQRSFFDRDYKLYDDCHWVARRGMWEGLNQQGVRTLFHVKRDPDTGKPITPKKAGI